jgi:hypothetical protein
MSDAPDPPTPPSGGAPARKGAARRPGRGSADEALAVALAAGKPVAEAAKTAGVSEATAYRRRCDETFAARVRELRGAMVASAAGRLADGVAEAADVLRKLLASESEGIQLRAAVALLEQTVKVVELSDLQERVADMERRLAGEGDRG